MYRKLPTISIVTCTYNARLRDFEKSLKSVKMQNYPISKLEHIVMDAGSSNGTVELARQYGCKVIIREDLKEGEQVRASIGLQSAKNDLILMLQSDNFLIGKNWLKELVTPFMEYEDIVCSYSAYNSYKKNMHLMTKYLSLIGATDPLLYYLGKSEKIPLIEKRYKKGKLLYENRNYSIVEYEKNTLPTIGDNGHMFLRRAINQVNKDPRKYAHVDAFAMLVAKGYKKFAIVNNSIVHLANPSILGMIKRRVEVKEKFYDGFRGRRKYLVMDWKSNRDKTRLFLFIVASLTFVYPLAQSINGFMRIRDKAWFLHPVVCFVTLIGYGYSEFRWIITRKQI